MRALVTGAAGFIGSHLVERLVHEGWSVVGVDSLTPYYSPDLKRRNLSTLPAGDFKFIEADLLDTPLDDFGPPFDVVFHQAGQPGVRSSWSTGFAAYDRENVLVTQRLLESCVRAGIGRFVYASSSSVYGEAGGAALHEDALPRPQSPYGVTKLAAEHLVKAYRDNFDLDATVLRYFTVFGPRQRPDMAFSRLLATRLGACPVSIFGDGEQSRDFTFVGDVIEANVLAAVSREANGTYNVAGGVQATVNEVLAVVTDVTGGSPGTVSAPAMPGDLRHTSASTDAARDVLGWSPKVGLAEGLAQQWEWLRTLSSSELAHYSART